MSDVEFVGRVHSPCAAGDAPVLQENVCTFVFGGDTAQTVVVGECIDARLRLHEGVTLRASQWVVQGCEPVAGYIETDAAAAKVPLQPPGPLAMAYRYYFTRPGQATVTISVTVWIDCPGGLSHQASGTGTCVYQVLAPQLLNFEAKTNLPDLVPTWVGNERWTKVKLEGHGFFGVQGFRLKGTVSATSPAMLGGRVRDVQTVLCTRVSDNSVVFSGEYVLDGGVPYTLGLGAGLMLPPQSGRCYWLAEDSPSVSFPPERRVLHVIEVFRYYLQYRSPTEGAIWVTLARWDWYWKARVERQPDGSYAITDKDVAYSSLADSTLKGAPLAWDLPEWRDTIEAVDARRGPMSGATAPTDALSAPVVAAAQVPGATPDPNTGPWRTQEVQPTSHRDGLQAQSGRQLVMFDPPPNEPYDPRRPVPPEIETRRRVVDRLGIELGPDVVRPDRRYWLAWCWPDLVRAFGYGNPRVLPQDLRCEGLDIRPLPQRAGLLQAFRLSVAPFCWGGDQAYWRNFAHRPADGPEDFTVAGYELSVRALAEQARCPVVHGRQIDAGTMEVVFRGMPPMGLVGQIAALPQTARILNYWGPLPVPYPDDM